MRSFVIWFLMQILFVVIFYLLSSFVTWDWNWFMQFGTLKTDQRIAIFVMFIFLPWVFWQIPSIIAIDKSK